MGKVKYLFLGLGLLFICFVCSCVTMEQKGFPNEGPVLLRAEAGTLANGAPGDLFVLAEKTVSDQPLTSQMIRRTAQKTGDAVVRNYAADI